MEGKAVTNLLDKFPEPLKEALATHECLRKLGFASEQIFMHQNPAPDSMIMVVLRHQGKQLALTMGPMAGPWEKKWTKLIDHFNAKEIDEEEFNRWYERSWAGTHQAQILVVMVSKGIQPPYRSN